MADFDKKDGTNYYLLTTEVTIYLNNLWNDETVVTILGVSWWIFMVLESIAHLQGKVLVS